MRLAKSALTLALSALLAAISSAAGAQPEPSHSPLDYLPALTGDYSRFDSENVGRPFHVYVKLPQSYESEPSSRYPIVYVLDGDSLFPIVAATHTFLGIDYELPEAIVVGIAYGSFDPAVNKRSYDFTPDAPDSREGQGGAADFQSFLKDELIPVIENRYRVDSSRRVLFGQSRGGGMVLYSAFADPDLFWGRIASNPTFEPGRELLFSQPPNSERDGLGLVVTSGSEDYPSLRKAALEWFALRQGATDLPWKLHAVTIEGGRHSSYSPSSYRVGMLWLFDIEP